MDKRTNPNEVSRKDLDKVFDLIIYKSHYALVKKIIVFLGAHRRKVICRGCLNSDTSENMSMISEPKCENNDRTTITTSPEAHIHWKKQFHMNPLYFRTHADFEADNEIDISSICNKTTILYKQNPVLNGYELVFSI